MYNFCVSLKWSFFSFVHLFPCALKMIRLQTFYERYKFCVNILELYIQCIGFSFPFLFLICCSLGPLLSCSHLAMLLFRPVTRLSSCAFPSLSSCEVSLTFFCVGFPVSQILWIPLFISSTEDNIAVGHFLRKQGSFLRPFLSENSIILFSPLIDSLAHIKFWDRLFSFRMLKILFSNFQCLDMILPGIEILCLPS